MRRVIKANLKLRYNIMITFVYIIGIVLLVSLFNLQVIHGQEYRDNSNTRLTRESTLEAARGSILDRSGNIIAGTNMGFSLEFYKTKLDNQVLNETILNIINVLNNNGDSYKDTFPIKINPIEFKYTDESKQKSWKQSNKIDVNSTAEECINFFKNKYGIKNENIEEVIEIISIRYRITEEGYSSTRSIKISDEICRESAIQFNERSREFPGVNVIVEAKRYYPGQSLASHIVGYIGKINESEFKANKDAGYNLNDNFGKTGIEYVFEKYLKGQDGIRQIDMAVDGTVTDEYISQEAISGADVVLTLDANLQKVTEDSLQNNMDEIKMGTYGEKFDAQAGAAVVMNVKTGEILALASNPSFNPDLFANGINITDLENYNNDPNKPFVNRAIQSSYAPGSTFKMVTAISALESGAVTLTEKINDTGIYPRGHNPVCWLYTSARRGHGYLNVTQAIQHSCNYFFYEMGYRVGIDTLDKYATYFGLGKKTGIELPNERAGTLASRQVAMKDGNDWYVSDTLSAAIGQSYNDFTPIQMAKYISILTNGGKSINPTLIKQVVNADGSEVSKEEIQEYINQKLGIEEEQAQDMQISEQNLNAVLEGMRSVTSETGGSAYSIFRNFNIEVGGKTGTAQAGDKTNAWFVGFAPFDDPEIAVVIMIENGGHGLYAAYSAKEIIAQYFGMNATGVNEDLSAIPTIEVQY